MIGKDHLAALVHKYAVMAELRASLPSHEAAQAGAEASAGDRQKLRALAKEFPGALRELDTLPTEEIARRRDALERAAAGDAAADWMTWMHGYHALMRAALAIKVRLAHGAEITAEQLATIARDCGASVDEDFAAAVASPPHGRLNVVVFDRLATQLGVASKTIWDELYPPRKGPRPYRQR